MKISVALCTYNGELFLKEQLNSILNQTLAVEELVICDDGSSDGTIKIINEYINNYPKIIKLIQNNTTLRSVKNFEKAISMCSGEIIFLSDQDDIWALNKVNTIYNYFQENSEINAVATNGYCIDENSDTHEKYSLWDVPEFLRNKKIEVNYNKIITYCSNIATGASMAIRQKIVSEITPFPLIKDYHHDEWIAFITSYKNTFELINDKLFYYRIHKNQQVGKTFVNKDENSKNNLINHFNLHKDKYNFNFYKRELSRFAFGYKKISNLTNQSNSFQNEFINKYKIDIENQYLKTVTILKKKYPLHYLILRILDRIQKKQKRLLK